MRTFKPLRLGQLISQQQIIRTPKPAPPAIFSFSDNRTIVYPAAPPKTQRVFLSHPNRISHHVQLTAPRTIDSPPLHSPQKPASALRLQPQLPHCLPAKPCGLSPVLTQLLAARCLRESRSEGKPNSGSGSQNPTPPTAVVHSVFLWPSGLLPLSPRAQDSPMSRSFPCSVSP